MPAKCNRQIPQRENCEDIFVAEVEFYDNLWLFTVNYEKNLDILQLNFHLFVTSWDRLLSVKDNFVI